MAKKEEKNIKDKTSFMKKFKAELKKVVWPTPKQLFNNTVAVLSIVLITAIIVFVLDFAFESINKYGVNKIKQVVTANNTTENQTTESTDNQTSAEDSEDTNNVENTDNNNNVEENVQ